MPRERRTAEANAASAKQQGRTIPSEIIKANITNQNFSQQFLRLNRVKFEQHVIIEDHAPKVAAKAPITGPITKITGMKIIPTKASKMLTHKLNLKNSFGHIAYQVLCLFCYLMQVQQKS